MIKEKSQNKKPQQSQNQQTSTSETQQKHQQQNNTPSQAGSGDKQPQQSIQAVAQQPVAASSKKASIAGKMAASGYQRPSLVILNPEQSPVHPPKPSSATPTAYHSSQHHAQSASRRGGRTAASHQPHTGVNQSGGKATGGNCLQHQQYNTNNQQQQQQQQRHLGHLFNRQMQACYAECHQKTQVMLAQPRNHPGTEVYLIDSRWMQEFKGIFFPHWLPQQSSQGLLLLPQSPKTLISGGQTASQVLRAPQTPKHINSQWCTTTGAALQLRDEPGQIDTLCTGGASSNKSCSHSAEWQFDKPLKLAVPDSPRQHNTAMATGTGGGCSNASSTTSAAVKLKRQTSADLNKQKLLQEQLVQQQPSTPTSAQNASGPLYHQSQIPTTTVATAAMQARIMERVKRLEPLSNTRIALSVDEAIRKRNLLACNAGDAQFNHMMRDHNIGSRSEQEQNAAACTSLSLMMGTDFEVISKDQWCLLVKYFSEHRRRANPPQIPIPSSQSQQKQLLTTPMPAAAVSGKSPRGSAASAASIAAALAAQQAQQDLYQIIAPVPLIRSFELIGLGIRTQIEYFMQQVSRKSESQQNKLAHIAKF